jgi:hypothetical protein
MSKVLICLLLILEGAAFAAPAMRESAFTALSALPIEEMERLAKVAACEGSPAPERWHFLVCAPNAENGYREYVVANHQVVARREFSQFAERLTEEDALGTYAVRVDSDRLGALALQYAKVNRELLSTCNYELSREGAGLAPRWKIDCLDKDGRTIGTIVVNAADERVVAHDGFKKEPQDPLIRSTRAPTASSPTNLRRTTSPMVARRQPFPEGGLQPTQPYPEPVAEAPERMAPPPPRVRRAEPVRPESNGPISRIFRGLFRGD